MLFFPLFYMFLIIVCLFCHFMHYQDQLHHAFFQLTDKVHCPTFREMTFQLFQSLVIIVACHTFAEIGRLPKVKNMLRRKALKND